MRPNVLHSLPFSFINKNKESNLAIKVTTEKINSIKDNLFILKPEYSLVDLNDEETTNTVVDC
jgi:hypothetical protein